MRLLRTSGSRVAYTSSRARIPPLVKRVAVSPVMSGSNRLMHSIINPAPAYPVIPTGQSYYRRGPGPSFSRNILISSSLIGVGLIVLAIHMLRTASETPISAAIRGMLWSEFSTKRVRSPKILRSSDSSNAIAFSCLRERNLISTFCGPPLSTDAMFTMSILSSSYRVEKCDQKKHPIRLCYIS